MEVSFPIKNINFYFNLAKQIKLQNFTVKKIITFFFD